MLGLAHRYFCDMRPDEKDFFDAYLDYSFSPESLAVKSEM